MQSSSIKFCVEFGNGSAETYGMMKIVYISESSRPIAGTQSFECLQNVLKQLYSCFTS